MRLCWCKHFPVSVVDILTRQTENKPTFGLRLASLYSPKSSFTVKEMTDTERFCHNDRKADLEEKCNGICYQN